MGWGQMDNCCRPSGNGHNNSWTLKWILRWKHMIPLALTFLLCNIVPWCFAFIVRRESKVEAQITKNIHGHYREWIVIEAIKYDIKCIFYWSHLIGCNSNIIAFSMTNVEVQGDRQVVVALMVVENGAVAFAKRNFDSWDTSPGIADQASGQAVALVQTGWPPHF